MSLGLRSSSFVVTPPPASSREVSTTLMQVEEWMKSDPHLSASVGVVRALTDVLRRSTATTIMGLRDELQREVDKVRLSCSDSMGIASGCELFMRFVTRTRIDYATFEENKASLVQRGEQFIRRLSQSREKIADLAAPFVREGSVVLVHGFSRVVLGVLVRAASLTRANFRLLVTESRPDGAGYQMAQSVAAACSREGLPAPEIEVIPDGAVAWAMDRVDMVFCGSEAIVENGGVINKIGTYQISIVARELNKPFYVAAESFKFFRQFPLCQADIPQRHLRTPTSTPSPSPESQQQGQGQQQVPVLAPSADYTPPNYISLLFTELGIRTPSAVSDELIRLYS